ncbi:MAG: SRPBCC family protein [Acidimicrobiales bacterium]|nr:SRPBCC family protein [Acidimicrobiales bacterium]
MGRIRVSTVVDATPAEVWEVVRHVGDHVDWMADAEAIRFTSARTSGVGTAFDCDTRVGPLRLTDRMEITEWVDGRSMGVRHVGAVTGTGRFTLEPAPGGRTRFTWEERLVFPWWMGGPVGGAVGGLLLRLVWARNLAGLRRIVEAGPGRADTAG